MGKSKINIDLVCKTHHLHYNAFLLLHCKNCNKRLEYISSIVVHFDIKTAEAKWLEAESIQSYRLDRMKRIFK